jgi:isopentenyl-diphosphate delta-isomerase type 1
MEPSEVDSPEDVASGDPKGAKNAAIRKLDHELGIPQATFATTDFKFLTRLHYWAADTVTHGTDAPWGEHEIDYVLFATVDKKDDLVMKPHPDEVDAVKWVTADELQTMLNDKTLLFSPWFRLIVKKWLITWWRDIDKAMNTDAFCDFDNIHEFDPPPEHLGGAGKAKYLFKAGDER